MHPPSVTSSKLDKIRLRQVQPHLILFQLQILINPHLPHELIDMGDEDHCPFVFVKRLGDDGKMAEVDMIRRFIEDEESWFFEGEFREHDETFLTFR